MNNLYKLLAFLCLVFVTSSINAQSITASVTRDGLIQVDESQPWQDEYVIDISGLNVVSYAQASQFFQKYVSTFGSYGQFAFDVSGKKVYMKIQRENSVHIGNLSPKSLNNALRIIYSR
ncbi:MAG: hypothetical protein IPO78_10585 [Saprospiraceae bacterium]|nr:hypothetical protein [Saprospiraceae bacterium]